MKSLLLLCLLGAQEFPPPTGTIVDQVGVLDSRTTRALTFVLQDLKRKTGAEVAVAVVASVRPMEIRQYGIELAERWKVGRKGEDTGVLIVVAIHDRKYGIEVGYGLEDVLPDSYMGELARTYFVPLFREKRYTEGITNLIAAVVSRIAEKYDVTIDGAPQPRRIGGRGFGIRSVVSLIFLLLVFSMLFRGRGRGRGGVWPFLLLMMMSGRSWGGGGRSYGGSFGGGGFGGFGGGGFGGGGVGGSW